MIWIFFLSRWFQDPDPHQNDMDPIPYHWIKNPFGIGSMNGRQNYGIFLLKICRIQKNIDELNPDRGVHISPSSTISNANWSEVYT